MQHNTQYQQRRQAQASLLFTRSAVQSGSASIQGGDRNPHKNNAKTLNNVLISLYYCAKIIESIN